MFIKKRQDKSQFCSYFMTYM